MSRYFRAEIKANRALNTDYFLLTFMPLEDTPEPEPGQFYLIGRFTEEKESAFPGSCNMNSYDPLLKRPFSLFRKTRGGLQILYRIRGKGTAMMRETMKGSIIHALGPIGNSYPMPAKDQTPFIVAGGVGIASVFSIAEKLALAKRKAIIHYGARSEGDLLMVGALRKVARMLSITTDDGSCGEQGCVTDAFSTFISRFLSSETGAVIYACGPRPMMAALKGIVKGRGISTYVSMEESMACGIGTCLGCVVRTVSGHKRVCKEGPVFDINEIVW